MDGWHPLHGSIIALELNEQHLAGTVSIFKKTRFYIHLRIVAEYNSHNQGSSFSPTDSLPFLNASQSSIPVVDTVLSFTSLCLVLLNLLNCIRTSFFLKNLFKVAGLKKCLKGLNKTTQMKHRNKQIKGDRMGEGTDEVDRTKTTRISLSFPISTGLSGFSAQKHCPILHPPSSSIAFNRDASNSTAWKEEASREKTVSKGLKSDYISCSSSPTLPIDLTAPVSNNCKSTMSFSVASGGPHFPTSALHTSAKMDYSRDTTGVGLPKDYPEQSTTETAHILFNLSARAYQGQVTKDLHRTKGKKRKGNSLHVELSLPLPSINPPSSSSSPPPLSPPPVSPLPLPPKSFNDSYQAVPKPELLCGVCHRLFSTASSLTVHMRLHRGGRLLSCRHCGKAFIHNKRLQSHEATCRQALPAFSIQPKQEPLEEGNMEKTDEATEPEKLEHGKGLGRPIKKGQALHGHHAKSISHSEALRDEDHFVKIVDGHIIYFCSVCERSYMTLSSLKRHSNVHSWRRKYPCHFCDKVFALAEYRTKHEVWHTGERRYQCIFCWEAFPTYYNLKTHQKAFHGISPGLISSEKTANGGYKQKVNALKLYRLLPMRSQKRPYKTYNQALADGLLKPDPSETLPLSLGCSLPPSLSPSKLDSFLEDFHQQDVKPDPESLLIKMDKGKKLATAQAEVPAEVSEEEGSDLHHSENSSIKAKNVKCTETAVSSVITFGRSKPSVIMHSKAVPSSVIVQRDKAPSADVKCRLDTSHAPDKSLQKTFKRHAQKDHKDTNSKWNTTSTCTEVSKIQQPSEKAHKGRKAHSKSNISKVVPISVGSEVKGSGPLCQITVRIGEEAIVKRSISETDLMRDKSPPGKDRKDTFFHGDQREPRHTHHHHHRKHHGHRSSIQEERSSKLSGKVRKYFFRQEVREDRNDQDGEDNLWRPYYSYKPKRKALHMHKIKNWQRKMHYNRSLRLMKRAEKLMSDVNKEGEALDEEEKDEAKEEEKEVVQQKEIKDNAQASYVPTLTEEKEEEKEEENREPEMCDPSFSAALTQSTLNSQFTVSPTIKQRWSGDQASECGSCGRWFSSTRKRDKHELSHLFEFVCLLCRATFPSQTKLEEHQRTSHPKNKPLPTSASCNSESSSKEKSMELDETSSVLNRHFLEKKDIVRLGRRPLTRYTCSQCDKVCKTSAALNCHLKRHEIGNTTEMQSVLNMQSHNTVVPEINKTQKTDLDITTRHAQPIPVINYLKSDAQHTQKQTCERNKEHQRLATGDSPTLTTVDKIQSLNLGTVSSPVKLSPTPERSKFISPSLSSVLVMNGAECLDFRTAEKRILDARDQKRRSLTPTDRQSQVCQVQMAEKVKTGAEPSISPALQSGKERVSSAREIESHGEKHRDIHICDPSDAAQEAQDLSISKTTCSIQAEDLSMPSTLAREKEYSQQTAYQYSTNKIRSTDDVMLIVPKEEPLSPVPSPTCSVIQTTQKGLLQRHPQSPSHSPRPLNLHLQSHLESTQAQQGMHCVEKQRSVLLTGSDHSSKPPSSRSALHPQVPHLEPEIKNSNTSRDPCRESSYPVQECALPFILPGGYCSGKKQEDQMLMSYPSAPLSFSALGKMVPHADATKLPFYPDPYQLLYGPQLLPYPYNLATLPMALNMMAPGDKVEPLPFLPTLFNYAAVGAPLPHPLIVNPSLYNSSSSTKRNSDNP